MSEIIEKPLDKKMCLVQPEDDFKTTTVASVNDPDANILLSSRLKGKVKDNIPKANAELETNPEPLNVTDTKIGGAKEPNGAKGGALAFSSSQLKAGSALAFNNEELHRQLRALKKGDKIGSGALATAAITTLINAAPAIISALKQKQGSGATPAPDTEDILTLCKQIQNQKKYVKKEGGDIVIGSGRVGEFFSNAWKKVKGFYNNNKDLFKPIVDSLGSYAKDSAQKYINKGADYLSSKTSNEHLKDAINTTKNIATDLKDKTIDTALGSGVNSSKELIVDAVEELAENVFDNENIPKKNGPQNRITSIPGRSTSITSVKPGFKKIRTNQVFI